ncbi:hypothetical protein [Reticulibacter mediterranei]|nr:hypothetical protein [Reticulibacter mediterranei]
MYLVVHESPDVDGGHGSSRQQRQQPVRQSDLAHVDGRVIGLG